MSAKQSAWLFCRVASSDNASLVMDQQEGKLHRFCSAHTVRCSVPSPQNTVYNNFIKKSPLSSLLSFLFVLTPSGRMGIYMYDKQQRTPIPAFGEAYEKKIGDTRFIITAFDNKGIGNSAADHDQIDRKTVAES